MNPLTDPKHCGSKSTSPTSISVLHLRTADEHATADCRTHCPQGATCENGECIAALPPPPSVCTGPSQCDSGMPGGDFTYCGTQPHSCICAGKDICLQYINCNEPCTSNADCTSDDGGYCVPYGCCDDGVPQPAAW